MSSIRDFGGDNAPRKGSRKSKRKGIHQSFRCVSCGTLRYVHPWELNRAAAPRCLKCGGPVELTESARKQSDLPSKQRVEKAVNDNRQSRRRCPGCGCQITSNLAQLTHLLAESDCVAYHRDEGKAIPVLGHSVFPGSLIIDRRTDAPLSRPWTLVGVSVAGVPVIIERYAHRWEVEEVLEEIGPVHFAR